MYSPEEFTILTGDGRVPNLSGFPSPLMLLASTLYSLSIIEVVDGEETSVSSEENERSLAIVPYRGPFLSLPPPETSVVVEANPVDAAEEDGQ